MEEVWYWIIGVAVYLSLIVMYYQMWTMVDIIGQMTYCMHEMMHENEEHQNDDTTRTRAQEKHRNAIIAAWDAGGEEE